ncbi:MAG: zinc ribbon domain-containing protein [Candidatus Omnitrophica bacterium]|nr:zinc ribbon domain-containing protein [Candidatus Omnitrophota bacterium]MCM8793189.1 zinc ribbon domain-containing protein [Candidatus Omnitrophota bacterium]
MPIYEFECKNCGKGFEELIRDKELLKELFCPHCRSKNINKIISKFSLNKPGADVSSLSKCSSCSAKSCSSCM